MSEIKHIESKTYGDAIVEAIRAKTGGVFPMRTSDPWDELAQRAAACPGWRWMPGMVAGCGGRRVRARRKGGPPYRGALPDLEDPATLGCLLALVRSAWGDETIATSATREATTGRRGWVMEAWDQHTPSNAVGPYPTEAAALVAALEAAP